MEYIRKIVAFITKGLVSLIGKNRIIQYALNKEERMAYDMLYFGYLDEIGWWNSFRAQKPLDKKMQPIPWTTYSFIDFIEERLTSDIVMLEFGSGNSTHFFSKKIKTITSVEHDKLWYDLISKDKSHNSNILLIDDSMEAYEACIAKLDNKYDIIFVDGLLYRNECVRLSIPYLTERGVIILDDSERVNGGEEDYSECVNLLINNGFKRLDFWGFSPSCFYKKSTTIFYKPNNCLNI